MSDPGTPQPEAAPPPRSVGTSPFGDALYGATLGLGIGVVLGLIEMVIALERLAGESGDGLLAAILLSPVYLAVCVLGGGAIGAGVGSVAAGVLGAAAASVRVRLATTAVLVGVAIAILVVQPPWLLGAPAPAADRSAETDYDHDGIRDDDDGCVTEAEDLDGVEDEDGCPEH